MRLRTFVTVMLVFSPGWGLAQSPAATQSESSWSRSPPHAWPQPAPLPDDTVRINPIRPVAYQDSPSAALDRDAPTSFRSSSASTPADRRETEPSDSATARPTGLTLRPPTRHNDPSAACRGDSSLDPKPAAQSTSSLVTIGTSLTLVLGLFLLVAWVLRRATPGQVASLPKGAVEVLGRAPLAGRQQLHLLRCGNKLLLVSVMPGGVECLTEITEPAEVDRLCGLCQTTRPDSVTAAFRNVLHQMSKEPVRAARRERSLLDAGYEAPRRVRMEADDGY